MADVVVGLVSVIVPVFNAEHFLRQALESITAQDYAPTELIVVDDGSTDGSAQIAASWPTARLIAQPNQGCGAAKNTGLAAARGEFLTFLDADDFWELGKLSRQVQALRQHPAAGFTTGHMALFLETGIRRPVWVPPAYLETPQPAYLPSGLMIRRTVFDQIGPFDSTLPICNDFDWLARARDAGVQEVVTPEIVVHRRVHADNLTHANAARGQELLRIAHASARRKAAAPAARGGP